jgi:hypothetical protein
MVNVSWYVIIPHSHESNLKSGPNLDGILPHRPVTECDLSYTSRGAGLPASAMPRRASTQTSSAAPMTKKPMMARIAGR